MPKRHCRFSTVRCVNPPPQKKKNADFILVDIRLFNGSAFLFTLYQTRLLRTVLCVDGKFCRIAMLFTKCLIRCTNVIIIIIGSTALGVPWRSQGNVAKLLYPSLLPNTASCHMTVCKQVWNAGRPKTVSSFSCQRY